MNRNWVQELAATVTRAPSADNSQPWALRWNGKALAIVYSQRDKNQNVFASHSHATLLTAGAVIEHVQAALAANAMTAAVQWPADSARGQPYALFDISDTAIPFVTPQGLLQRHTNRGPFLRTPLPDGIVREFGQRHEGTNRTVLLIDGAQRSQLVRLTRLCSEARFCNKQLHQWLIGSLRFTPGEVACGDGLDVRALCLPPGGKYFLRFTADWQRLAALNRFGVYKLLALSEVALLSAAPALLCVIGGTDTRSVIDGGRLLSRTWTDLNMRGIAVHPYYVISDQINRLHDKTLAPGFDAKITAVESQLRDLLALHHGEMLHIVLRVGYSKVTPERSRRLPLEAVLLEQPSE